MLKDTVNINTYLNILLLIVLFFFGFIFNSLKEGITENGRKIDRLISVVNENKIDIAKVSIRVQNLEDNSLPRDI